MQFHVRCGKQADNVIPALKLRYQFFLTSGLIDTVAPALRLKGRSKFSESHGRSSNSNDGIRLNVTFCRPVLE